jgi:hypothetical protein
MKLEQHTAGRFENGTRQAAMIDGHLTRFVITQTTDDTTGAITYAVLSCPTAFGAIQAERAQEYAKALDRAAQVAQVWNKDIGLRPAQVKDHRKALTGLCAVCLHYGDDCEGSPTIKMRGSE